MTGMAVLSPLGCTVEDFWNALVDGAVGTGPVTRFDPGPYSTGNGGEVSGYDPDRMLPDHALTALPLSTQYAVAVTGAALRDAGLAGEPDVGVCLGTVMGTRPHLERLLAAGCDTDDDQVWMSSAGLAQAPARVFGLTGPTVVVSSGCSAGNDAIGLGFDLVSSGQADRVVVGGAEELSEAVYSLFTSLRALARDVVRPFDIDRGGILPSEGAAALVLESTESASARGAPRYARLLGYSCGSDAHHLTAPHPQGRAVVASLNDAFERSGIMISDVGYVSAHGTGTSANDGVEAAALARVFSGENRPPVSSVKGALGHAQGAASALEAVVCVLAIQRGRVPGMPTLHRPDPECTVVDLVRAARDAPVRATASVAFGFGGSASAIVLGAA